MCPPVGETHFNLQSAKLFAQLWRRDSCCQAAQRCAQHVLTQRDRKRLPAKKNSEACRTKRVPTRWLVVRGQTTELEIARDGYQLIVT